MLIVDLKNIGKHTTLTSLSVLHAKILAETCLVVMAETKWPPKLNESKAAMPPYPNLNDICLSSSVPNFTLLTRLA